MRHYNTASFMHIYVNTHNTAALGVLISTVIKVLMLLHAQNGAVFRRDGTTNPFL